eukprot:gb/GECG01007228.1/.p1 GENE.gb/GECG01007228.1/~~gb/GECG01007228.1/.p1  ORF type:complete len:350 (+),score=55.02 gb/GECG01007228.1/:1-1050(+)
MASPIWQFKRDLEQRTKANDVKGVQDILKALDGEKITLQDLKETKIGHVVYRLRRHPNQYVVQLALELVKKWKDITVTTRPHHPSTRTSGREKDGIPQEEQVSEGKSGAPLDSHAAAEMSLVTSESSTTSSSTDSSMVTTPTAGSKDNEGSRQNSQPKLSKPLSSSRKNCMEKLRAKFMQLAQAHARTYYTNEEIKSMSLEAALNLEQAIFDGFGKNCYNHLTMAYKREIASFHFNLGNNAPLALSLMTKQRSCSEAVKLPKEELANPDFRERAEKDRKEGREEAETDWEHKNRERWLASGGLKRSSGQFVCSRCKSDNTEYMQMQLASGDEPMTTFITCNNCGKRWKQ